MIKAGNLQKGNYVLFRDEPTVVLDKKSTHLGRGTAKARLKLKGLVSGNIIQEGFNTDDNLEDISIQRKSMQYLYQQDGNYVFMDPQTYDQLQIKESLLKNKIKFLKEGATYQITFYDEKVIDLVLPKKVTLKVVKAEKAIKGDTVSGATNPVTLETGLVINVPLFVEKDDNIVVSTETLEYVERK